jgi:hypothetical protein
VILSKLFSISFLEEGVLFLLSEAEDNDLTAMRRAKELTKASAESDSMVVLLMLVLVFNKTVLMS